MALESAITNTEYIKLSRAQHWRLCPNCGSIAMSHNIDGSSICGECLHSFRWLEADLAMPVNSIRELFQEIRWAYDDRLRRTPDAKLSWMEVGTLYWGQSSWPPRTPRAARRLAAYRLAILIPLALALPVLTLRAQQAQMKGSPPSARKSHKRRQGPTFEVAFTREDELKLLKGRGSGSSRRAEAEPYPYEAVY